MPCKCLEFIAVLELLPSIGACGVEQPITNIYTTDFCYDERLRDQIRHGLDNARRPNLGICYDRRRCLDREGTGKNTQPTQNHPLLFRQSFIAPIESRAQRPVPRQRRASPAHQEPESIVEVSR